MYTYLHLSFPHRHRLDTKIQHSKILTGQNLGARKASRGESVPPLKGERPRLKDVNCFVQRHENSRRETAELGLYGGRSPSHTVSH